jgi:hypothetical protein
MIISGYSYAQNDKAKKEIKFDKKLVCPFEKGMGREPKEAYTWDPPDKKVIMISQSDSLVRSCIDSKVLSINPTEDGRFELVIFYKEYYFWYYGINKALVNNNQTLKAGDILGTYIKGQELEFRMFKDEEMMDPREYLRCLVTEEKKENPQK